MTRTKSSPSGYRAKEIKLRSASFRVEESAESELSAPEWDYAIRSVVDKEARSIVVTAGLRSESADGETAAIDATIVMRALFNWSGEPSMPPEEFARTNAPAFLWPYLREIVWSLTVRAGQPPLLLPIMNLRKAEVVLTDAQAEKADTDEGSNGKK